ncbi:MAG: integrase family protein [Acidobacteriaceae bacterium]|nr:integrase family protein [Acidobacteriaceae bacterium]
MKERDKQRGIFEKVPGDDKWWIRYTDSDKRYRREYAGTYRQAVNLHRQRKTEALQGVKMPDNFRKIAVTFAELAGDALEWSKVHKRSWTDDEARLKPLVRDFGTLKAETIKPKEIEAWLNANTRTPATANRYRALLSLVYRQGIRNQIVSVNPARAVTQRAENNGRIRWLRPEEETRIRAVMAVRCPLNIPALDVALNTGMRAGEQFNLKWDHVDLDRRQIIIDLSKNGTTRHITLNDAALAALMLAKRDAISDSPYVFLNCYGRQMSVFHNWFGPVLTDAKIEGFRWHDLRHTFVSRLVMAGVGLGIVQKLAGHKTIAMTSRYAHLSQDSEMDALRRMSEFQQAVHLLTSTREADQHQNSTKAQSAPKPINRAA